MKSIAVNVHFKGVDYTSDYNEFDPEGEVNLYDMMEKVSKGTFTYLEFKKCNRQYYFPSKVLQKSIISLIYG